MSTGLKANVDGSAAIQVGGVDAITLTSAGAASFVTSPMTIQGGSAAAPSLTFSGDTNTGIFSPAADTIAFSEGGVESMRIDARGNLGLGVTPSAWGQAGTVAALQIKNTSFAGSGNNAYWGANWYGGGFDRYIANGFASLAVQTAGQHVWYNAPSGTAGNAITFTQAMTLDASGNLFFANDGTGINICSGVYGGAIRLVGSSPTANRYLGLGLVDNSRNFLEYARIDNSGNLLVGTTTAVAVLTTLAPSGNNVAAFRSAGAVSATRFARFDINSSTEVGSIQYNGTGTSYVTTSDYRLKEDVEPMTGALAKVQALKPCTYTWKSTGQKDEGFIAHELAEVCPRAVSGEKDAVDEEGNIKPQGIDTSFLVATLTAAIQELKAELDATKAEVALLKGAA